LRLLSRILSHTDPEALSFAPVNEEGASMFAVRQTTLRLLLLGLHGSLILTLLSSAHAATVTHIYELNGNLADTLGGPNLVSAGGTLGPSNYSFGPNQGLSVGDALADPAHYSIEMIFRLSDVGHYARVLDFQNLTKDTGLYVVGAALDFFISAFPGGSQDIIGAAVFQPNQDAHVVFTRDAISRTVVGYVNGVPSISFTDLGNHAVFGSFTHFFIDDTVEASSGVVDRIRFYDGPLTESQVMSLFNGGPPPGLGCLGNDATIFVQDGVVVGGPDDGKTYIGTLRGTSGNDVMVGTDGPDLIKGLDGDDIICGGDGDDRIEGGYGNDWIDGGPGDDLIKGQQGDDTLFGGEGNDRIEAGPGNDFLDGGPGNNTLNGEAGTDTCTNGPTFLSCQVVF
jgi:hypothetical protein